MNRQNHRVTGIRYRESGIVPTKNDGMLSPQFAVWHKGDNPNDKVHNWYYGDTGAGGGYNDLELLRYKRTYTEGPNKKGDLERPMKDTHDWLKGKVLGQ